MSRIKVEIGDRVAYIALKESAVQSVPAVVDHLPLTVRVEHATRSGNCAIAGSEEFRSDDLPIEGQVSMYYPGMVAYDPRRGYLVLAYGQGQARSSTGTHWVTYLGDVVDGLPGLAEELQRTRDVGAATVTLSMEA